MKSILSFILVLLVFPAAVFAARPLSTDDAGTVEKGHLEVESGFEYADDTDDEYNLAVCLKYGLGERWDLGVEIPYQFLEISEDDDVDGWGDIVFSSKYHFLDETESLPAGALSFSIKTETGDDDKGLGSGAIDYAINAILSKELEKVTGHLNLGYTYTGAPEGEESDDLFTYALAIEFPLNDSLNLVAELTAETNFEGDFDSNPFAALVGFNYAFSESITFDLGMGWGISEASADYLVTTGLTLSF